jgi:hypothetical protein
MSQFSNVYGLAIKFCVGSRIRQKTVRRSILQRSNTERHSSMHVAQRMAFKVTAAVGQ